MLWITTGGLLALALAFALWPFLRASRAQVPGDDVTGMVARIPRVRGTMELLLGGAVYHYHTKLMMKDARTGGV